MRTAILAAAGLVLAGCAHMDAVKSHCLPQRAWSAADEKAVGQALTLLPGDSPLTDVVIDWMAMRDANRACLAASK
jgi:hypothetical protein